jgi:hypothetical protein
MKVAFVQTSPEFGRVEKNVEKAVKKVLTLDCDLVVLPELFNTGYQFRSREEAFRLSEEVPGGYTTGRLLEAAKAKKAKKSLSSRDSLKGLARGSTIPQYSWGLRALWGFTGRPTFSGVKRIFSPPGRPPSRSTAPERPGWA